MRGPKTRGIEQQACGPMMPESVRKLRWSRLYSQIRTTYGAAGGVVGLSLIMLLAAHATEPTALTPSPTSPSTAASDSAPASASSTVQALQPVVVTGNALTVQEQNQAFDTARDQILLPKFGATEYTIDQQAIATLPQGQNTPIDKVLLQAPGVSYDSAISNPDFHVRNEYANVQYRINGIQLPDGVSALGSVLETSFIGNLNLLDGALPAQYGLRTAGVVDMTTKSVFDNSGQVDLYGGSQGTISPSVEYGGTTGNTQYFVTGRYLQSDEGLESATPTTNPIHDHTTQEKFFGYGSTLIGNNSRLTYMGGAWVGEFQIPNVTGQTPLGDYGPTTLSSANINENETDRFYFGLVALQTQYEDVNTQFSAFTRYAATDFVPDLYNDLAFNDVASAVTRKSMVDGVQFDMSDRLSDAHTLRAGFGLSLEQTRVNNLSTVLPLDAEGNPLPTPINLDDYTSKRGWDVGGYVQDEWTLSPDITLNTGVRFDQMEQFVTAHQFSPRIALIYKPLTDTTLHAGVSRYFTPPMQAQATPNNLALFQNTTQEQTITLDDPVKPERATYFDVGVDQTLLSDITAGLDAYYKRSTDTLDDGQFGQAVVLNQFNYAHGFSRGAEFKINYQHDGLRVYANASHEITMAKEVVSNQYLIGDPVELAYLAEHYTPASDAQKLTASTGVSYRWGKLLASVDGIYGSGLHQGFANLQTIPGYTQWNAAIARDFALWRNGLQPLTVRLSAINLFDRSYLLRGGTGIGEFAPQYGPRREIFLELTQKFGGNS